MYTELRRIARCYMSHEHPGQTLQATALVYEAWLRLIDLENVEWQDRAHFFAVSAQMMRGILIDRARSPSHPQAGRHGCSRPTRFGSGNFRKQGHGVPVS
jgi:hypothetical protein